MEEAKHNILDILKKNTDIFPFFLSVGEKNQNKHFINDFVGLPAVPLIGKYGRQGYEFNNISSLIVLECFCDKDSKLVTLLPDNQSLLTTVINLPIEVKNEIFNIPEKIKHNKNEDIDDQKDENQKQKKQPKQQQNKSYIPDFHPFKFNPAQNINFTWSISLQNQQIDMKYNVNFLNLVCHPFIFQEINFEQKKRIIKNIPTTLIIPKEIQNSCGVSEWTKDTKNISFNKIRSEYLSCHLFKGQSLCFSPNNMKFEVNKEQELIHFWSVQLMEDNFHYVNYHWNIMQNYLFDNIEQIIKKSKTIHHLITQLEELLGKKCEAIIHLKSIFSQ